MNISFTEKEVRYSHEVVDRTDLSFDIKNHRKLTGILQTLKIDNSEDSISPELKERALDKLIDMFKNANVIFNKQFWRIERIGTQ